MSPQGLGSHLYYEIGGFGSVLFYWPVALMLLDRVICVISTFS